MSCNFETCFNVNDLPNCTDKLSVRSFADDTNIFFSSDNLHNLESVMNHELKQIYKYCALKTSYLLSLQKLTTC